VIDTTAAASVLDYAASNNAPQKETVPSQVSIVLLSYNRPQLLSQALASLQQQSYQHLEVIVVDNPSSASAAVAQIVSQYPTVKLIQTDLNIGYAGGMNRGIANASGDYVYLTEDDIVLDSDCIDNLVRYLEDNPSTNLVAPVIYNKESGTIRCAGGELALDGVYQRKIYGAGERDAGQFAKPFEVTYIDGATMFARREFWQRFKGFREEYFMYVEAVELSARVSKAGLRMAVVPQAKVYHFEPEVGPIPPDLEFHKLKNFFSLYLLHAPARILPEFVCRYAFINGLRSLLAKTGTSPRVFFKALLWVARKTPGLLRERYAARGHSS
jgi:GT2 family glycosyltransferase